MAILVFAVFVCVWTIPLFIKRKKVGLIDRKVLIKALLLGLIPASLAIFMIESLVFGNIFKFTGISKSNWGFIAQAFISYALTEEIVKYFFGKVSFRKEEKLKKIDMVMIFGCVGLGYEITESLIKFVTDSSIASGLLRGVSIAHVMFQFFMGAHVFEALMAKQKGDTKKYKKEMTIALLVPILIHGIGDACVRLDASIFGVADEETFGAITLFLLVIINLIYLILGLRAAYKSVKVEDELSIVSKDFSKEVSEE